jgi:hypothetical protein
MYYLNSGIAHFEGLSELDPICASTWTEDKINAHYDKIKKEMEDEIMTDEEINDMIQAYLNQWDPGNGRDLLCCMWYPKGICGGYTCSLQGSQTKGSSIVHGIKQGRTGRAG